MAIREEKVQFVEEITAKFQNCICAVLADYRGLTVAEDQELRKKLREAGVEYRVVKNTLTRRATQQAQLADLNEFLVGPTAIAFSQEDPVSPAKILVNFSKDHADLEIKAGVLEGKVIGADEIKSLASLPSREGLLSMFLSVLQAPLRNFALAVKAVAEKQES